MKTENSMLQFSLQGIKTEQFAILVENFNPKKETGLAIEVQFKINQINNQIGVFLGFEFVNLKKSFIKILVSCHFKIQPESWNTFINSEVKQLIVPKGFLAHLAMITTGTTRGILHSKLEGTQFSQFIIPTVNIAELITEDSSFDLIDE